MDTKQILKFCLEKGLLVDKDVLNLFNETADTESVKLIIEKIKSCTKQNVITKNIFYENKEKVNEFLYGLPKESQKELESLKIKLGLSIEISREKRILNKEEFKEISEESKISQENKEDYEENEIKISYSIPPPYKKIEV